MNLSVGIVGLPNVGKSTLFNALLKKQASFAEASVGQAGVAKVGNFAFTTIEPNVGVVAVPDKRLQKLAEVAKEEANMGSLPPTKPATVEFVDIAGLVKGAAEGAGLGNKFLSHIREVKVIAHVVRAFEDPDVVREGSTNPKSDYETIQAELILADLQTLEKIAHNRKTEALKISAALKLIKALNEGKRAFDIHLTEEEIYASGDLFLLTAKPELVVLNVDENALKNADQIIDSYADKIGVSKEKFVVISAKVEAELASLTEEEQKEYLSDLGVEQSGLERLIQKAYELLGLISFLTAGEIEVRAWTIKKGIDAQNAAGEIHTDFIKKFIKAEIISFEDYVGLGGRKKSREVGKARLEGRDYIVQDGDVVEFKIGS